MKIIDLTLPLNEETPVFPGDPEFRIEPVATIGKEGFANSRVSFGLHFGTHIDAPAHFIDGGKTLSDFQVEHLVGDALVLPLDKPDLGAVRPSDFVFFYSSGKGTVSNELAQKMVEKKVRIMGVDAPSPDSEPFEVHKLLLENDILIVENLVGLGQLVGKRFRCFILPLKLENANGAPCRVIAAFP